jgi:peptide/nickel transport system substrate-binding protein
MMLSPAAFAAGAEVSRNPICSGPYKFVEREQNDRIVVERFAGYRDAADYHFDRVIFRIIPDTTIRLTSLQSGGLDMLELLSPTDIPAVESDPGLEMAQVTSVGYQGLTINVGKGKAAEGPLGRDKRVRQALQLAIDRDVINQVVGAGTLLPTRQPFGPASPYHDPDLTVPGRNPEQARRLLKAAGYDRVSFALTFANTTPWQQVVQLIQSMAAEAGFDIVLRPVEFAAMIDQARSGDFDAVQIGWSGRYDPDGNIDPFASCDGGLNYSGFCDPAVDKLLDDAKITNNPAARKALYHQAQAVLQDQLPMIYLFHQPWIYAFTKTVKGFVPMPDGLIRLKGVSIEGE